VQFIDLKAQQLALLPQIQARMARVMEHGQYIMGPEVAEMEAALCSRVGVAHCIGVASGTEALLMALMALGVGPGDEVITTPFSFIATAEVIVRLGATPIYADIEPDTCNISAAAIAARLSSRTKAIMPVSLYGQVADMDAIAVLASKHGIAVVEDAAQSFGALLGSRQSCGLSLIGCTSFFPSKPLGCYGDGGAVFTNDADLAQAMRELRVHGQTARYTHVRVGLGARMDTLQCAVVLAKLERFDWELKQRQLVAARYAALFQEVGLGSALLTIRPGRTSAYAQFTIRLDRRDEVARHLQQQGIPTAVHYPIPIHRQSAYRSGCCPDCCPEADRAAAQVLSLPMHADLGLDDQRRVVQAIAQALAAKAVAASASHGS
jgi:UDP-2-acetamido-2-deoxy-ribo-hexuluronate aminotransferase